MSIKFNDISVWENNRVKLGKINAMGCTQGKYRGDSASRSLEKMKMDSGYSAKGQLPPHRRSTGQRYSGRLYQEPDRRPRRENSGFSSGESGGSSKDRKQLSDRVGKSGGGGSGVQGSGERADKRESQKVEFGEEELVDGWPKWLIDNVPSEVLAGLVPKSAENYDKLDKVGQGTYSNVYKARDKDTGKIVALKKVRLDTSEPESVKFMAREIIILQKLDHPNVVKLEGLATSRFQYSLYLVFDFMQTDLATIITRPGPRLTEPQVKCYMNQLLSGLQHCHDRGILHRDIKGSNLLINKNGMLKIADFGLANYYSSKHKHPLTSRVVTLWYRAPELLLGATDYGVGIDLWSAGCFLAEMFLGRPFLPGRTEVEQLHRIFKLCGTPSDDYWKKLKLSTTFRLPRVYRPSLFEACSELPESSLGLLTTLLALDPARRGSASSALQNDFFHTKPLACDLPGLPVIWKEEDELAQASEQRKPKNLKMARRSRTYREHGRRDLPAEKPKENSGHSNAEDMKNQLTMKPREDSRYSTAELEGLNTIVKSQEKRKIAKTKIQTQEAGSSSSSSSSGRKLNRQADSPTASPRQKMSPMRHGIPNGGKNPNNLPPLPLTKSGKLKYDESKIYRLNQVHRSASTRESRKSSTQRKYIELFSREG